MSRSKNQTTGGRVWSFCQIAALAYIVIAIIAMIVTNKGSTFGIALFFLMLWNVVILIGLFVWYIINSIYFNDSDLFHGMYVGVSLMAALNILAEAIILIAETVTISGIEATKMARMWYIILAIVSVVLAVLEFIYVKLAFYSKRA